MDDKKNVKLVGLGILIVIAIGFLAFQMFGGDAAGTNPPVVEYANQPPSDSSAYRGADGAPRTESNDDRM